MYIYLYVCLSVDGWICILPFFFNISASCKQKTHPTDIICYQFSMETTNTIVSVKKPVEICILEGHPTGENCPNIFLFDLIKHRKLAIN